MKSAFYQNTRAAWEAAPLTASGERQSPYYLTAAAAAKAVREALKRSFPGVKFSVRTTTTGSLQVNWTDGPQRAAVDGVVRQYCGGGFDGMIDLAYYVTHWLMPDGSTVPASSPGTAGSGGLVEAFQTDCPGFGAVHVSFGSRYIFTSRELSAEAERQLRVRAAEKYGYTDDLTKASWQVCPFGDRRSAAWFMEQIEE